MEKQTKWSPLKLPHYHLINKGFLFQMLSPPFGLLDILISIGPALELMKDLGVGVWVFLISKLTGGDLKVYVGLRSCQPS